MNKNLKSEDNNRVLIILKKFLNSILTRIDVKC